MGEQQERIVSYQERLLEFVAMITPTGRLDELGRASVLEYVQQIKAEAYDEAIALACELTGVPNVNWPNPYRVGDAS